VQSINDPDLIKRLVQDRIPLTVCPLSNLKLRVYSSLSQHNIGRMLEAGIVATINSDDPAYFGGYINENFQKTFAALQMGAQQAYQLALNSFNASFIDASERARHIEKLDAVFESF
jgi:adenosine deaminase